MDKNIQDVSKPDAADRELNDDELASVSGGVGAPPMLAKGGATLSPGKGVAASCMTGTWGIGDIEGVKF